MENLNNTPVGGVIICNMCGEPYNCATDTHICRRFRPSAHDCHLVRDDRTLCGLDKWEGGNVDIDFGIKRGITNCVECLRALLVERMSIDSRKVPADIVEESLRCFSGVGSGPIAPAMRQEMALAIHNVIRPKIDRDWEDILRTVFTKGYFNNLAWIDETVDELLEAISREREGTTKARLGGALSGTIPPTTERVDVVKMFSEHDAAVESIRKEIEKNEQIAAPEGMFESFWQEYSGGPRGPESTRRIVDGLAAALRWFDKELVNALKKGWITPEAVAEVRAIYSTPKNGTVAWQPGTTIPAGVWSNGKFYRVEEKR